jgi:hypothetical protein
MGSIRMVSMGTGKPPPNEQIPHFRHIFRDSFLRRGFDAWMSTMDTDTEWRNWRGRLSESVRGDCHRLDVSLANTPQTIDAVGAMNDYRDLVLLQPGSARMARDASTTLLISRFFFQISSLPEQTTVPFWCPGSVRCKGPARSIILALENLYPEGLSYVSDSGLIDGFGGLDSLCPSCGCYNHPISFLTRHLDYTVNVYIQSKTKKRWRISGFPESVATFASRQGLQSSFGHGDHGSPSRKPCQGCDVNKGTTRNKRKIAESWESRDPSSRKRAQA